MIVALVEQLFPTAVITTWKAFLVKHPVSTSLKADCLPDI